MIKKNKTIKRKLEGVVVSDKMNKTIVVKVESFKRHPLYHKIMRVSKRFKAHDEKNECKVGDVVVIEQTRPLSKEKRWKVAQIIKRADINNEIDNVVEESEEEKKSMSNIEEQE
ncbi:MAG: 30S ribosomal protein S17 [Patescibacteria group bacterium]|jgi:small subunit ribosomal protein S17|nr:30S ribosomal protein S17 [Patescibacteria group bacterium]